jgi:tetratricopeptide (TPR) repeat protein
MHKEALEAIQRLSSQRNGRNEPALEDPSFVRAVAEIQRRAGALGDAQQTLLEALEKLPPSVKSKREQATRSRFLQSLARVKLDLKDRKAASMYLTEAATMERLSHGNSSKLVDLLIENARLIGEEHQPEQALADLKTALTMARKAGDLGQQIHVLRATGDVLDSAGRKAEALPVREECEQLGREHANTIVTWLDDLNALATLLNDLGRTDEAMDKALSMWTRLQEETDFTTGDHSKLERIYSGLIKITESFQQKKGTHDRDQLVAEWKRRQKALDEPVP